MNMVGRETSESSACIKPPRSFLRGSPGRPSSWGFVVRLTPWGPVARLSLWGPVARLSLWGSLVEFVLRGAPSGLAGLTAAHRAAFALAVSVAFLSCTKDPSGPDELSNILPVAKGVYVLHEGNYGDASGARLALYDLVLDTVYTDIVERANSGLHLGSTGDDMVLFRDKIYVLMSGSENVVVLSRPGHQVLQSVYYPGSVPHAMVIDSVRRRIYVTRLYKNSIIALDLTTLAVVDSVTVGANPQEMALVGDDLYVCNSGYGLANTVSILSVSPLATRGTLRVGAGPTGIVRSDDGALWVSCTGNPYGTPSLPGGVYKIDPATRTVQDSILFTEALWGSIAAGDGAVYVLGVTPGSYYGGPVHRIQTASKTLAQSVIAGTFYAIAADRASGDLYLADAKSFGAQGEVRSYTSALTVKKVMQVQRGPAVFAFAR
ncbi:MAG: beta-propeller repeat-containing protein [Bacteroidetes bacterium]|nr:beta-propeller repeat-containing protein [Bacteroidota bacterium]